MLHLVRYVAAGGDPARTFANQGQLLLNVLVGIILPMLVGVVTHRLAASWVKSLVLLALSIIGGLLTTVTVASFRWQDFVTNFLLQFGSAVVAHYGALKPTGITGSNGVIQKVISAGIGRTTTDVSATTGPRTDVGTGGGAPDPAPAGSG